MKRFVACVCLLAISAPLLAVGGNKAQYIGGTLPLKENAEGKLHTATDDVLTFTPDKKEIAPVSIPYASITELEYGQKAGRRVGAAVGTTLLLGPVGLVSLFSKKRKHYLTISYTDASAKEQVGVFELGKDIVRTTVKIVETRSGKDVLYQDEEAKKALGAGR